MDVQVDFLNLVRRSRSFSRSLLEQRCSLVCDGAAPSSASFWKILNMFFTATARCVVSPEENDQVCGADVACVVWGWITTFRSSQAKAWLLCNVQDTSLKTAIALH